MRNKKIIILSLIVFGLLFCFSFSKVKAITADEIQVLILQLQLQIATLQEQLAQIQETPATWCHDFNVNLRYGDSGSEVKALQTALEKEGFTISASEKTKSYFGEFTASAVVGFQEKYKEEILDPWGLAHGTGFVGNTTRAKLDKLYGCAVETACALEGQFCGGIAAIQCCAGFTCQPEYKCETGTKCPDSSGKCVKQVTTVPSCGIIHEGTKDYSKAINFIIVPADCLFGDFLNDPNAQYSNDLNAFITDANKIVNDFLSINPINKYKNIFNFYYNNTKVIKCTLPGDFVTCDDSWKEAADECNIPYDEVIILQRKPRGGLWGGTWIQSSLSSTDFTHEVGHYLGLRDVDNLGLPVGPNHCTDLDCCGGTVCQVQNWCSFERIELGGPNCCFYMGKTQNTSFYIPNEQTVYYTCDELVLKFNHLEREYLNELFATISSSGKESVRCGAFLSTTEYCYSAFSNLTVTNFSVYRINSSNVGMDYCINNIGNADAGKFYLKFYNLDNPSWDFGGGDFDRLSAGEEWCGKSSRSGVGSNGGNGYVMGNNRIKIFIDSNYEVKESNENDNELTYTFNTAISTTPLGLESIENQLADISQTISGLMEKIKELLRIKE